MSEQAEKKYHAFKSRLINSKYVFKDGSEAHFTGGQYVTEDNDKAAELKEEIAKGNIYIFQEVGRELLTEADLDPLAELRKKIIADYLAEQEAKTAGTADFGTSDQGKMKAVNTIDVAGMLAASNTSK